MRPLFLLGSFCRGGRRVSFPKDSFQYIHVGSIPARLETAMFRQKKSLFWRPNHTVSIHLLYPFKNDLKPFSIAQFHILLPKHSLVDILMQMQGREEMVDAHHHSFKLNPKIVHNPTAMNNFIFKMQWVRIFHSILLSLTIQ